MSARNGDHMMVAFECDLCVFVKLKGRYPIVNSSKDRKLIACIRRVNLDAFWSRATSTINNNLRSIKKILLASDELDLPSPFVTHGPMPREDHCGYQIAISMVLASLRPGKHSKAYTQFDTIRNLRTAFGAFEMSSSANGDRNLTVSSSGNTCKDILRSPTSSVWFRHFYSGCRSRMGQVYKPNLALSTELIVNILKLARKDIYSATDRQAKFDIVIFGTYVAVAYVLSLRGSEGLMLNLSSINKEWDRFDLCVVIALKGKVKGESNVRDHMFPCCKKTKSGIDVKLWLSLMRLAHLSMNRKEGPAMTNMEGEILSVSKLDEVLHSYLIRLFRDNSEFPLEIKNEEEIEDRYSVFRSLRRASDTRALNQNVSSNDIDVVNRWKTLEAAKGKKPGRSMRQHYAEFSLLKEPFLRYTSSM